MPFGLSVVLSGVPLPAENGVPMVTAVALLSIPEIILSAVSQFASRLDGYAWNWKAFRERFRLRAIRGLLKD